MKELLISHGIQIKEEGNQLFALDAETGIDDNGTPYFNGTWMNVTAWTEQDLTNWLGY